MLKPLARSAVFAVVLAAWLLASNHCLAACLQFVTTAVAEEHAHCGSQETPANEKPANDCDSSSCCTALSAVSPAAKSAGYDALAFITKEYPVGSYLAPGSEHYTLLAKLDTGPPGASSFAERVLQRSLLAHAPPLSA